MSIFSAPEEISADDALGRPASEFKDATGPSLNDALVERAELRLGVRLPSAYLELLRERNGGYLREDVEFEGVDGFLTAIAGIGYPHSIDSDEGVGGLAMSRTWEYPNGMIWLDGDGHTGFFLDYRTCGPEGEPPVVWLDSEAGEPVFVAVAPDFGAFVRQIEAYVPNREE